MDMPWCGWVAVVGEVVMDVVAEKRLVAVYPDGASTPIHLRVGRPMPHPRGDWFCEVVAEGLRHWQGPSKICGVETWQALMLGLRFLREVVRSEVRDGAVFHWEDGEHVLYIDKLFPFHDSE